MRSGSMYIIFGIIVLAVVAIFVKYGSMDYFQKNNKEWGRNEDIREAERKKQI